jgi:hypothetical protein
LNHLLAIEIVVLELTKTAQASMHTALFGQVLAIFPV